jgi:hypothetical protein
MPAWLSYRLSDFLLFSAETYGRLFERANAEQWPLPAIGPAIGLLLLAAAPWFRAGTVRTAAVRVAALLTGGAMLWVAYRFLWTLFLPINPAMEAGAIAYAAGGALLIAFGLFGRTGGGDRGSTVAGILALTAVLGYPILALALGQSLPEAEFVGVAPDPTAVAAAGVALMAARRWIRVCLLAVPAAWLAWSALTLFTLDVDAWMLPAAAAALSLTGLAPRRSPLDGASRRH